MFYLISQSHIDTVLILLVQESDILEKGQTGQKFYANYREQLPNIQKTKIMASGPITSWQIDGETVADFILGGTPKSLQMVIAAMKLEDTYSLEGKLWPT